MFSDLIETARAVAAEALAGADDGEVFIERRRSESLGFDDGRLKNASDDSAEGFGLRAVRGEQTVYAHAAELNEAALRRAAATVRSALNAGQSGSFTLPPAGGAPARYAAFDPLASGPDLSAKIALLQDTDARLRRDSEVVQVSCGMVSSRQEVCIVRPDGFVVHDVRPLVRFNVSVVVERNGRRESGFYGCGGRIDWAFLSEAKRHAAADEALRQAKVNLEAVEAPAGDLEVVLGAGWPGVLLHEAVGHGLEGDFNRKGVSAFSGLIGQRVAAPGVTVIDDGTLPDRRGSLNFDDEGTPTGRTVLIEDGILVGYLQDRQNARLMNARATGNGRRESYACAPMPRMTNTFMESGTHEVGEMIAGVNNGLYAVNFGGGQVDITSGRFVFTCTEAYRIENGRITAPVKNATLIGCGPEALHEVSMIGNDMRLDDGVGTCGKAGQSVPVGVGQPSLRLNRITVGGTA